MAKRSKSGLKRKTQSEKRRVQNKSVRSELKTLARIALTDATRLTLAVAELDRAARKGIIHKKTAARKKSRLMRRAQTATQTQ